ncbi:hypothetical protein DQ04_08371030 [Trypanosoma grayi]|uniref:hypothetical protein n=1 Tax=Trypanosoma grayi TaxID=71804 RepID=UPI0004F3EFBD|nr:hypothetical protein DQ04_08371030 [Trypanosoma grayi]KEG07963.1 hypothetical protein DQ04_08371030 [Trypanosoma grayi]
MNEAYRAAVLGKARRSKPRAESGQQQEEQKPRKQKREPEEPQKASGTKRMRGEVATATAVDQPAVKRKK